LLQCQFVGGNGKINPLAELFMSNPLTIFWLNKAPLLAMCTGTTLFQMG